MPPDQLTAFLQYGYGTLKDEAATLLTLYAASLAFLAAFSDKILNIAEAPARVRRLVNWGLYALIFAIFGIFAALWANHEVIEDLQIWCLKPDPLQARLASAEYDLHGGNSLVVLSSIFYLLGLFAVFIASFRVARDRSREENKKRHEEEMKRIRIKTKAAEELGDYMQELVNELKKRNEAADAEIDEQNVQINKLKARLDELKAQRNGLGKLD